MYQPGHHAVTPRLIRLGRGAGVQPSSIRRLNANIAATASRFGRFTPATGGLSRYPVRLPNRIHVGCGPMIPVRSPGWKAASDGT